ncbi:MAG: hypothetical protein JWP48_4219 [Actinoallomurus sp.]|jgi:hypothetical protein|nr:hypothetical protein [Actinoallomurus sp.]
MAVVRSTEAFTTRAFTTVCRAPTRKACVVNVSLTALGAILHWLQ